MFWFCSFVGVPLVERFMSGYQTERSWQGDLVARYSDLFNVGQHGGTYTPGYPECGAGWRDLLERACARIRAAVAADGGTFSALQIKEKYGSLRFYWTGRLSNAAEARVEEAIELAEARSACTCETCGKRGRLFKRGDWLMTACDEHGTGEPVAERRDLENAHVVYHIVGGKPVPSARRYDRETDTFVYVPPGSLGIEE
jgi:hypothetical protein